MATNWQRAAAAMEDLLEALLEFENELLHAEAQTALMETGDLREAVEAVADDLDGFREAAGAPEDRMAWVVRWQVQEHQVADIAADAGVAPGLVADAIVSGAVALTLTLRGDPHAELGAPGGDQGRVFVMFRTDRASRTYSKARCSVRTPQGAQHPLHHLAHHSLDGFEWGYNGSGPADLARSMVGLILGVSNPHPLDYQPVKEAIVALLPEEGGEVKEAEVRLVLSSHGRI